MGKTKGGAKMSKGMDMIALVIAMIGTLNWGLVGLFDFNLVSFLFGGMTWLSRIIYILVAISGLYLLTFFGKCGRTAE